MKFSNIDLISKLQNFHKLRGKNNFGAIFTIISIIGGLSFTVYMLMNFLDGKLNP